MLEEIKKLKESIDDDQFEDVAKVLGDDLYKLFLIAISSKTEESARTRVKEFGDALKKHPIKAFKLYGRLRADQKVIIQHFIEE